MFSKPSDNDMVECPYNKHHRMSRKRLQPHLLKCRLSYPDAELLKCPFNATHLVAEPEFTNHATNCPDRALITQYKYNTVPIKLDEEARQQVEVDCEENWDDTEAEAYDPKKYASKANVIRTHIGSLPSDRKLFRKEERKRLGDEDTDEEDGKPGDRRDYDWKAEEEEREEKWYEDRSGSNAALARARREKPFEKSRDERSRERGVPLKRDKHGRTQTKTDERDGGTASKRSREDAYPLDDDPYYRTRPQPSGSYGSLGLSRGARKKNN